MTAGHAETEMYPGVSHLEALLAALGLGSNVLDRVDVRAGFGHDLFLMFL
jgi:hypothetical protein